MFFFSPRSNSGPISLNVFVDNQEEGDSTMPG